MPGNLANTTVWRIASLTAAVCFTAIAVRAADLTHVLVGYSITSWSTRNGGPVRNGWMPSSNIWALAQDPDGYVWLGTESGLVRFDGERFITWVLPVRCAFPQVQCARSVSPETAACGLARAPP